MRKDGFYWVKMSSILGAFWYVREFRGDKWILPVTEHGSGNSKLREFPSVNEFLTEIDERPIVREPEPRTVGWHMISTYGGTVSQPAWWDGKCWCDHFHRPLDHLHDIRYLGEMEIKHSSEFPAS